MSTAVRAFVVVRRRLEERWALVVLAGVWPLLGLGRLNGSALGRTDLLPLAVLTMFGLTVVLAVGRELRSPRGVETPAGSTSEWDEVELGLLLLTAVYLLIAATGGLRSFLYPLVYALVSFLMVVHRHRRSAVLWLMAIPMLEWLVGWPSIERRGWALPAYHLTLIGFFAAGNLLVLSSLVARLRRGHDDRVQSTLDRIRQEARDFRLFSASSSPQSRARGRDHDELAMAHAAVEGIHDQLFYNVDLLRTSMRLHSCVLLWCDPAEPADAERRQPKLTVKETSTDSEMERSSGGLATGGVLASIFANLKPVRLRGMGGKRQPPYYTGSVPVTDLCAVPLMEGSTLRGILCADRTGDRPFSTDEEQVLSTAASHMLRVVEHERVFSAVERSKYEQERFYRASELLNEALTAEDVHCKAFAALRAITHYDLAVITRAQDGGGQHQVVAVDVRPVDFESKARWSELAARLDGLQFCGEGSLVGISIKNRHHMPASGEWVDTDSVVFTPQTRLREARSLLILPLLRGEQVLGTITLATARPHQYSGQVREMLRVIGHQVGVSLQNARMYHSMEERATTDGLTGLVNRRAFQERLDQLHALAERTGQKYAVILTDIDHFKRVNDTYGHPVGDEVLRRVAAVFGGRSRRVDIVARYGGEEFVLVLPDTDGAGAEYFSNELRKEISQLVFHSDQGPFGVTISMGVAEFPSAGREHGELLERADQALYFCKENGRNCVRRWSTSS